MALSSDALTTIAACEEALSITAGTENVYLTRLTEFASSRIKRYCNRTFYWEEDIEEYIRSGGTNHLVVSRRPVSAITSVEYNDAAVSSDDYKCVGYSKLEDAGTIYNSGGWYWPATQIKNIARDQYPGSEDPLYKVTYDGGWVTPAQYDDDNTLTRDLPYDLEQACIDLVVMRYRKKGLAPGIKAEKLLSWSATYEAPAVTNLNQPYADIPSSIKGILDAYKTMVIA